MNPPTSAFWRAYVAYQAAVPTIEKDDAATVEGRGGRNYSYGFATLVTVFGQLLPCLSQHGLALVEVTRIDGGTIFLRADLVHGESDSGISAELPVCPVGTPPQQLGSALSYCRRYLALLLGLLSPAGEDDDGAAASKPAPRKPATGRTLPSDVKGGVSSSDPSPRSEVSTEPEPSDFEKVTGAVKRARSVQQLDRLVEGEKFRETLAGLDQIEKPLAERSIAAKRQQLTEHLLSQRAALAAKDPRYWRWIEEVHGVAIVSEDQARQWQLDKYGIVSRSVLDSDSVAGPLAASDLNEYAAWLSTGG